MLVPCLLTKLKVSKPSELTFKINIKLPNIKLDSVDVYVYMHDVRYTCIFTLR